MCPKCGAGWSEFCEGAYYKCDSCVGQEGTFLQSRKCLETEKERLEHRLAAAERERDVLNACVNAARKYRCFSRSSGGLPVHMLFNAGTDLDNELERLDAIRAAKGATMPDLTPTQLQRIRSGCRLVAFPITNSLDIAGCEMRNSGGPLRIVPKEPVEAGSPIDPSLPGLVWGKARAVRRVDVTEAEANACGLSRIEHLSARLLLQQEFSHIEWLWLVEVRDA